MPILTSITPKNIKNKQTEQKHTSLLFNLRNNTVWGIRANFSNQYLGNSMFEGTGYTIPHNPLCWVKKKKINVNYDVNYKKNYVTLNQQIPITILISRIMELWDRLLEGDLAGGQSGVTNGAISNIFVCTL